MLTFTTGCLLLNMSNTAASPQTGQFTLVYTGNLNGELEPCGCAVETDLGGIKRRATMIQSLRDETPDLFLLSSGGLLNSNAPRDKLKGLYILKGMATMNYDAIGVQWRDLAYGSEFTQQEKLPWVNSNWYDDSFKKIKQVKHNNINFSIFNWMDPRKAPQRQMLGEHQSVTKNTDHLKQQLSQSHKNNRLNVVLSTLSLKKARKHLPLDLIDILFIRTVDEEYGQPKLEQRTLILQPGTRGMRIGKIDIKLNNNRISHFKQDVFKLPDSIADAAYLTPWYTEYNARVKENYEKSVAIKKLMRTGQSPYVGEQTCKSCHSSQYKIWKQSKHANAFEQLEAVNKAFDPDCIGCHTVGFEKSGGYIDTKITAHLLNVQCESCHGAGKKHADSAGAKPVANAGWSKEKMCSQCHIGSHSPEFKLNDYWSRIAHN